MFEAARRELGSVCIDGRRIFQRLQVEPPLLGTHGFVQQQTFGTKANPRRYSHLPTKWTLGKRRQMPTSAELAGLALRHGRAKKRNNAIVAVLCGVLPAAILASVFPSDWQRWLSGVLIGCLWGNAFEYAYHRWLLHLPGGALSKGHLEHHASIGKPNEPEHVSLGASPLHVALLFAGNGIVAIGLDLALGLRVAPGIFLGWAVYLVITEEIHWRIHTHGPLPPGFRFARAHHMRHHKRPDSRYSIFLPVFDFLLRSNASAGPKAFLVPGKNKEHGRELPRSVA